MGAITRDNPVVVDDAHDAHVWAKQDNEQREIWAGLKAQGGRRMQQRDDAMSDALHAALMPAPAPRIYQEFMEPLEQTAATPAPVESATQRRARLLAWHTEECRIDPDGALQRVFKREAIQNPKADRSNIGKDIKKAREADKTQKQAGEMYGQLIKDGKRPT